MGSPLGGVTSTGELPIFNERKSSNNKTVDSIGRLSFPSTNSTAHNAANDKLGDHCPSPSPTQGFPSFAEARARSAVYSRSPSTPRSRQARISPTAKESDRFGLLPTGPGISSFQVHLPHHAALVSKKTKRKHPFQKGSIKHILALLLLVATFFLFDGWVLFRLQESPPWPDEDNDHHQNEGNWFLEVERPSGTMYERLLGLAAHSLAEGELRDEPDELWAEPFADASAWKACANERVESDQPFSGIYRTTGYIMVSANGGLNQQRVAICNAVAVARLLNATLVLPHFLYSNVWKDTSQFGDIYQQSFFINFLKDDVLVVEELPEELQSLDLEAIGSFITDMDVIKEAKPSFYTNYILPILLRNGVVHFYGFGNRLSFDPVPFALQRLRCKCNFHALKFVPQIQRAGALLVERMREKAERWGPSHDVTRHSAIEQEGTLKDVDEKAVKYLGLHLRFEVDMAAYSMCEFGGGEREWLELEAYREIHFPTLMKYKNGGKLLSAAQLREEGKCPLTPEEAVLMLVALGFKRGTRIFLAGAHIYGGQSRMVALTSLYPNLVTKEDLLSPNELEPFMNRSSQLAALDFIACAASDVFAMTDSGSQLSSLVSGYRIYYGAGLLPTIRPNKRRLASIFSANMTIEWVEFRERVRKTVKESKRVQVRPLARSVYRHPRCSECMCESSSNSSAHPSGPQVLANLVYGVSR